MNSMTRPELPIGPEALAARLSLARATLKPPPTLNLVEWADTRRRVATKTSATPGQWKTSAQPVAYGPMLALTEPDTNTVTVMAGTQVVKTEFLLNTCFYYIDQDPSSILFVQPSQGAAESFSKERFAPTVAVTPALRRLIARSRTRDSANTIAHKEFPGGSLDFVGANSPTDLSSRPKRIILCDEIDKYPASAGSEGDPLKLAEERASTYRKVGRAKFCRTCSPTEKETSRIGREYAASDRRRCFVACPHCGHHQVLTWAQVMWSKNAGGEHLPKTAGVLCSGPDCGAIWNERDRVTALKALERVPDHGWRQTRPFVCCGERREPSVWDDKGRARCPVCEAQAPYGGHAGFHISKLYSSRHELAELVKEFLEAKGDPELLKKFINTALAELWEPAGRESQDGSHLIARAELYGPEDLPNGVLIVTGFCDIQNDRLEIQLVGWGRDEECWPFLYEIINLDPAQPKAWRELDALLKRSFRRRDGRILRVAAFAVDIGDGHHAAQGFNFCRRRRGRRIFPTHGLSGKKPIWPVRSSRTKTNEQVWRIGVDTGKDAIYARAKIDPPEPGQPKPGFIHFPAAEGFGPEYFEQLFAEHREQRKRMGQTYSVWVCPDGKRNEALDTFVGALAVRRSLPRSIELALEYEVSDSQPTAPAQAAPQAEDEDDEPPPAAPAARVQHSRFVPSSTRAPQGRTSNWFNRRR